MKTQHPNDTPDAAYSSGVRVSVPATCANLGPGFDCLALALDLANIFEVNLTPAFTSQGHPSPRGEGIVGRVDRRSGKSSSIARHNVRSTASLLMGAESSSISHNTRPATPLLAGEGVGGEVSLELTGAAADLAQLALEPDNLFVRAFRALYAHVGLPAPSYHVRITVGLPPGRGLGSSATAVVGGLLAANALLGEPLCREELLDLAVASEPGHHADNVAAALFGGLVVTGARDQRGRMLALTLPAPALHAVLFIPEQPMSTVQGRSLLPESYPRREVAFNLSRVALLLGALQSGRFELLATAMEDCVHQPYREQLFPALGRLIAAGYAAGAQGVCLSGGGSSVLALVADGPAETGGLAGARATRVAAALEAEARSLGVAGVSRVLAIARTGAEVTLLDLDDLTPNPSPTRRGVSDAPGKSGECEQFEEVTR